MPFLSIPLTPDMRRALDEFRQAREALQKQKTARTGRGGAMRAGRQLAARPARTGDTPHAEGGGYGTEFGDEE